MRVLAALFLVLAVAQAYDADWDNLINLSVIPEGYENLLPNVETQSGFERIVNGEEATHGQFPWQAALFINTPSGTGFCGGSILNKEWILTAAHCVDTTDDVDVILGAQNIREEEPYQVVLKAAKVIVHENWDARAIKNDVALIKLPREIEFNAFIRPVRLATDKSKSFAGTNGVVSGWGRTSDDANGISNTLQWTENPIARNSACNLYYFGSIGSEQICLMGRGGRSSCNGDSGGPLVIVEEDDHATQVGVVSFGIALGCARGWPGVYSRVSHFVPWIEANTELTF